MTAERQTSGGRHQTSAVPSGSAGLSLAGQASSDQKSPNGRWLNDTTPEKRAELCEAVIDLCAALFNVSGRDLRSHQRCAQDVARVRQIAMYLCNTTLGLSLTAIGRAFGRDRTTVSHAVQLVEDLRDLAEFDAIMEQAERIVVAAFYHRGDRND
jgi:hypothetical protein